MAIENTRLKNALITSMVSEEIADEIEAALDSPTLLSVDAKVHLRNAIADEEAYLEIVDHLENGLSSISERTARAWESGLADYEARTLLP